MYNVSICIPFIVAILGIAYPILFQVVSRLDEKYSSQDIIELFRNETENKVFISALVSTMLFLVIWMLKLPPAASFEDYGNLVDHSAEYLFIISTITLIISFFLFVNKILFYYTPTRFLPYLINRQRSENKKINIPENPATPNSYKYLLAISDILYYSIKNQNEKIAKTISDFMYGEFKSIRDQNTGTETQYPALYYEIVYKSIEELAMQKNRRLIFLEDRTAGSVWLLGEFGNNKVSETTYAWLWNNLLLSIKYERDDYVIYHWQHAFQHIQNSLDHIPPIYTHLGDEPSNQKEMNERENERKRFLDFHYALGGLLLYKKRYQCLERAFSYTQSIPPQYALLPDTMNEVFKLYFDFLDPYDMKFPWLSSTYHFPDLSGLNSSSVIKKWICKYIALLFLRQYTIVAHLSFMTPMAPPAIPTTQAEKRRWIDHLDYFRQLVEELLADKNLLDILSLNIFEPGGGRIHGKPEPLNFIQEIKDSIVTAYDDTEIIQPISENKRTAFNATTASILTALLDEYQTVNNTGTLSGDLNRWYINGQSHIVDKSSLAENQYSQHLNIDSFLASGMSRKFKDGISEIFGLVTTRSYLFNESDIISAINKLEIDCDEYVIVSFGIRINELIAKGDLACGQIKTIEFYDRNYRMIGNSIFVLKISDLPKFNYKDMTAEDIQKYSLSKIIDQYNIYTSLIDLNQAQNLIESFIESNEELDLRKSAYMAIFMSFELQWKKSAQIIQIKQTSEFRERGIPNKLSDIEVIQKKTK